MTSPLLLFDTVRHLRPVQVTNRLRRRLFPLRRVPAPSGAHRLLRGKAVPGAWEQDAFNGRGFRFLHRELPFEGANRWSPAGAERLWTYNLHYFRYLERLDPGEALRLMRDWIASNVDPRGPGWEPYPLTQRIREWIEWLQANPEAGAAAEAEIVASVARQTAALEIQVEYHLLGNHVLENAATLCWAGLSLEGPESARWLERGKSLLLDSLADQILADGGHEERSPMYQALLSESLLRLAEVAGRSASPAAGEVREAARRAGDRMVAALGRLVHPDRGYALFNDTALDGAPAFSMLWRRFFSREEVPVPEIGVLSLPQSGYYVWRGDAERYLVFDAGPVGPDHQPGHGHADALSFELSWNGRRIFTDTGATTYEPGPVRDRDRGTAAHNTIQIDGRDQSELWSAFRCGRRISITEADISNGASGVRLAGAYEGPGRLRGRVAHRRTLASHDRGFCFVDELRAAGGHDAALRLHLAPGLEASPRGGTVEVRDRGRAICSVVADGFDWSAECSPYHPEFGLEIDRACLTATVPFRDELRLRWAVRFCEGK